jgi:aminoglycoside phosphotransferase (APT) family kinase protein
MRSSPPADVPGVDVAALARYLPDVLDDYDRGSELQARLLAGGRSNLTCLLSQPDGKRWVLRRPPLGHVMPSAHDMSREFRALSGLAGTGFPAPRPRALCTDHSVLGVTFLIYDFVPGLIIADEAASRRLTAAQAGQLCGELAGTLARLHAVTPPPAPPGRSVSAKDYLGRQVARWTSQWQHTATRELPAFDPLARWLREEISSLPADYEVTTVHGDYRLDNLVLDPDTQQVRAVLDWEMSTLGDPLMDLALLLVYWESLIRVQPVRRWRHATQTRVWAAVAGLTLHVRISLASAAEAGECRWIVRDGIGAWRRSVARNS